MREKYLNIKLLRDIDLVIHFGVTNMPGAVPRTSTQALSRVLLPYVARLCDANWLSDAELCSGINAQNGEIILSTLT